MASPAPSEPKIRRALISVHDPRGLAEFARGLARLGIEIVATSGTRRHLEEHGVRSRAAEELTGIGAWFGGRIKTLHPGLLGGILAPRTEEGRVELAQRGLEPIDLVAVNLYPFEAHSKEKPAAPDLEEFIDIGGVTLLRAAAKNHAFVAVVAEPEQYAKVLEELESRQGSLSAETRRALAVRAFERTAEYDRAIAEGIPRLGSPSTGFPRSLGFSPDSVRLRYGENPHQRATAYRPAGREAGPFGPPTFDLVKGGALSYSNLLDLDSALGVAAEFTSPTAAVVKHANPCGVASAPRLSEAIERAIATDPVARYGCVIAVNHPFSKEDADPLRGVFVDLLVAPAFAEGALERLERRPKLKVVRIDLPSPDRERWEVRSALGRLLLQEVDRRPLRRDELRPVTRERATAGELDSLEFAWKVVRHARSNAIVLAKGSATVGIGSGQPARVRSVQIAVGVAGDRAKGSVLASDAFFPFPDGVEAAGAGGVRAILQPGGSLRDAEVIEAADRLGLAMYFTGWRVFRH